jgi:hypothetical protein
MTFSRKTEIDSNRDIIVSRFKAGEQIMSLAKDFNTTNNTIKSRLKLWGAYENRGKKIREKQCFTEEEKSIMLEMHDKGDSFPKIGKAIKCRPIEVSKYIKSLGLFRPRRNKDFKLKITEADIISKFKETGSIRSTSWALSDLDQKYIRKVLRDNGFDELNSEDIYIRLEKSKAF